MKKQVLTIAVVVSLTRALLFLMYISCVGSFGCVWKFMRRVSFCVRGVRVLYVESVCCGSTAICDKRKAKKYHFLQVVYVNKVWPCLFNSETKVDNQYLLKYFQNTSLDKEKRYKKGTNHEYSFLNEINQGQDGLVIYREIWSH